MLNTNSGIFFEFVPMDEWGKENSRRLPLEDVQIGVNYALIISSNAGLWAYSIGDTVKFISLNPYRIIVSGRIKHYISAFGEHVIGEEVDYALTRTMQATGARIVECTVAPFVSKDGGKSHHQWFIEFEELPANPLEFATMLDQQMRDKNVYYDDLIRGAILDPLKIIPIRKNGFVDYMRSIGKLGGQNKVPRLSNDRNIADALMAFRIESGFPKP